jgi:hypothetical protein
MVLINNSIGTSNKRARIPHASISFAIVHVTMAQTVKIHLSTV